MQFAWEVQNMDLPIWCPVRVNIVYDIPLTTEWNDKYFYKENKYLYKWLGISPNFTLKGQYIRSGQLQLSLSSLVEGVFILDKGHCWTALIWETRP